MNQPTRLSSEVAVTAGALAVAALVGVMALSNGALAMAIPFVLVGGLILFARPVIGLFLFAAMIPVESALMIGGRSLAALVGMAVFGAWAAQKLLRRERLLPLVSSGLVQLAILLFAFACLSLLWAQNPFGVDRRLILLFQLMLLTVLVLDLASSWERVAWVAKFLVLAGTVAALMTLEQYFLGGARRAGEGVVGGLNRTALTLVTILPFAFYLLRSSEATAWRLVGLAYIGLSAVAVAATFSRMNFLMFPMVVGANLALMAGTRRGRQGVALLGAAAILVVAFMPMDAVRNRAESIVPYLSQTVGAEEVAETYSARGYLMRLGLEMFRDRPILGSGYDNYRAQTEIYQFRVPGSPYAYVREGRSPHSSHVAIMVGLGVVGLFLWFGLFGMGIVYAWQAWRRDRDPSSNRVILAQAVGIAILLQLIYGFYSEVHQDKLPWLLLGLAVALRVLMVPERDPNEPLPRPTAEIAAR